MDTQVAIIGAGPAGLLLSRLLHRSGIANLVLERRSRDYVLNRVRAGVLEQGTVELLDAAGVGARCRRQGLIHEGIELAFGGTRHRIDFVALTGRSVTVYGQTEVTRDLVDALAADGVPPIYEAEAVLMSGLEANSPSVSYRHQGAEHEILNEEILVALETRAGGNVGRDDALLVDGEPGRLRPCPPGACVRAGWLEPGLLVQAAGLNGRALFQALETGDLIALGGHSAFERGHFAQQLDHQGPSVRRSTAHQRWGAVTSRD